MSRGVLKQERSGREETRRWVGRGSLDPVDKGGVDMVSSWKSEIDDLKDDSDDAKEEIEEDKTEGDGCRAATTGDREGLRPDAWLARRAFWI